MVDTADNPFGAAHSQAADNPVHNPAHQANKDQRERLRTRQAPAPAGQKCQGPLVGPTVFESGARKGLAVHQILEPVQSPRAELD